MYTYIYIYIYIYVITGMRHIYVDLRAGERVCCLYTRAHIHVHSGFT